ncbi:MAG TPA: isopentenyl-diphosphate Delta-isomerase [Bacteroidales bacterium]|nr:isopentenyl-diphosphate Delta-isomerase [Bacteroidales bacterium]HPT02734.1 isopentenyl-diphosphate Delta-isomerase [Bacteroidales bacterium]
MKTDLADMMTTTENQVILVDGSDNALAAMPKLKAHEEGALHRAVSVIIMNSRNEMLLQQRAYTKYHSSGLWSNTACSHPCPGESAHRAATRRLQEEMGITCRLKKVFDFTYRAQFANGLTEHEFDHVFFGRYDGDPMINPVEVHDFKWMPVQDILNGLRANPQTYTVWFRIMMEQIANRPELFSGR